MKKIFTTITLLASSLYVAAQAPAWVKYSGPSNYANYDVTEVSVGTDSLGNVYTGASMADTVNNLNKSMLVKYNSTGVKQWIKTYDFNDPASYYRGTYVVSVLVDKAGNSYVCGYGRHDHVNAEDFMVMKYDNAGNQIWLKYWDGGQSLRDYPTSATFDKAGNIVVAGVANYGGTNGDDVGVAKWSTAGVLLWSYVYNNSSVNGEDRALAVASDVSNNTFITGSSYGSSARDMITIKIDNTGAGQWVQRMARGSSGDDERGFGVATDATGNCYVTGSVTDWQTVKYDANGTILWTNTYTAHDLNRYNTKKVIVDKHNNVIVTGDAGVSTANQGDLVAFKLNNITGTSVWNISFNNRSSDNFTDAIVDTMGNIYISGYFDGVNGGDISALILSPIGAVLWNSTFSNPLRSTGGDRPYQIVLDNNRNIIMAGVSETRGSGADAIDVVTLKFGTQYVTGIKNAENKTFEMSVYPNPAKDYLTVSVTEQALIGSTIALYNILGEKVADEKLSSLTQQLNLNTIAKGVYILTITTGQVQTSKKLIIE